MCPNAISLDAEFCLSTPSAGFSDQRISQFKSQYSYFEGYFLYLKLCGWQTWCYVLRLSVRIMGRSWVERFLHDTAQGYIGASRAKFRRVRE